MVRYRVKDPQLSLLVFVFVFKPDKVIKDAFVFQALKVLTSLMAENLPPTRVRTWPRCSSEAGWSAGGL